MELKQTNSLVRIFPFTLLAISFVLSLLYRESYYETLYRHLSVHFGISTGVCLFMGYFIWRLKMCLSTKIAIIGLFSGSVLDAINLDFPLGSYYFMFQVVISGTWLVIAGFYLVRENILS